MGLTPEQELETRYDYYEVYDINKTRRYGLCSQDEKDEMEIKHPNQFIFEEIDLADSFVSVDKLEILLNMDNALKELEEKHNIEILYACEAGSRVWGFNTYYSDYDVRFIYRKSNPKDYLTLNETRDVIEYSEPPLDIVGWDVKKALKLHYKNNPNLREWLLSDQVYIDKGINDVFEGLGDFDINVLKHHYESIALNHKKKYCNCEFDKTKIKKYKYILRCILTLELLNKGIYPPLNIDELINHEKQTLDEDILDAIAYLVHASSYFFDNFPDEEKFDLIQDFINDYLSNLEKIPCPDSSKNIDDYNERFQDLIYTSICGDDCEC